MGNKYGWKLLELLPWTSNFSPEEQGWNYSYKQEGRRIDDVRVNVAIQSAFESIGSSVQSVSWSRRIRHLEVFLLPLEWDAFIWLDYLQHITLDFIQGLSSEVSYLRGIIHSLWRRPVLGRSRVLRCAIIIRLPQLQQLNRIRVVAIVDLLYTRYVLFQRK